MDQRSKVRSEDNHFRQLRWSKKRGRLWVSWAACDTVSGWKDMVRAARRPERDRSAALVVQQTSSPGACRADCRGWQDLRCFERIVTACACARSHDRLHGAEPRRSGEDSLPLQTG